MKRKDILLLVAALIVIIGFFLVLRGSEDTWLCQNGEWVKHGQPDAPQPATGCGQVTADDNESAVELIDPQANDIITSPVEVTGRARGNWFFEGSFPVQLVALHGKVIATGIAQAQGDWMTDDWVPFAVTLSYEEPEVDAGELVLVKDNPSGLPEYADEFKVPVRFR